MTVTLDPQLVTDILQGLATLVLALVVWSFWSRMRKELIAARIAVANLQMRMAESEAKSKQKASAPPATHHDFGADAAIDHIERSDQLRQAAIRSWQEQTGRPRSKWP
jgi:hypothetical protein